MGLLHLCGNATATFAQYWGLMTLNEVCYWKIRVIHKVYSIRLPVPGLARTEKTWWTGDGCQLKGNNRVADPETHKVRGCQSLLPCPVFSCTSRSSSVKAKWDNCFPNYMLGNIRGYVDTWSVLIHQMTCNIMHYVWPMHHHVSYLQFRLAVQIPCFLFTI
jgi:hypothetical protein